MKKLLIIGDVYHTEGLIRTAQKRGIYTIVTDNLPVEKSGSKKIADEYWNISVSDIDAIERKAKNDAISGVLCGASELCVNSVRILCKRLKLPFWISDRAYEITNDKVKFKEICKKNGLPVAKDYDLTIGFKKADLEKIEYPVVVKPADNYASIGVHVCNNEEELLVGYRDAYNMSTNNKVVVEKFLRGWETTIEYCFKDGTPYFFLAGDHFGVKEDNNSIVFGVGPSRYMKKYEEQWKAPVEKMFSDLNCRDGYGFVQFISDGDESAVLEMNYRLTGGPINNSEVCYNHMIDFALSEETLTEESYIYSPQQQSMGYLVWLKPGKIAKIGGMEKILDKLKIIDNSPEKKVGDIIIPDSGMRRIFKSINFFTSLDDIKENIDFINKNLVVEDVDGNDMVYRYDYR